MKTFQEIIKSLDEFWMKEGAIILFPYDIEKGAGTFNPATFFYCLGSKPIKVAYVEPSRRPTDGRYAKNPFRLQHYFQYQVIIKPPEKNIKDIYLSSLKKLGLDITENDIRFVEDDWESPTLGAWGLGWEVRFNGLEITQFTYFQQMGGVDLEPISCEITYGVERIAMILQNVESVFDIEWGHGIKYGDLYKNKEEEFSKYNFEIADVEQLFSYYKYLKSEINRLLSFKLIFPAYDYLLKISHTFNLLDARGVIGVKERQDMILSIRELSKRIALSYIENYG
ncbi:MAG: glycine--tRNA ligase subunit alpha [bacterium]|nr:glycine--tRNA ligase subunit alpha [bacterium]